MSVKFEKLQGRIRAYVQDTDIYDVDSEGYVTDKGRRIDAGEFLDQLVYAGVISPEAAEAQDYKDWL